MTKKNTVAVLLTCYNRREKTLKCLQSLFEAELPDSISLEVFLVDDGSSDGTSDTVKKLYSQVNLIYGDGNLFWNRGMNLAWKNASEKFVFDFFLWLNDDVVLKKDAINILLRDFRIIENTKSIVVGACQSIKGDITYSGYISLTKKIMIKPNREVQFCEYFNGNVVFIPDIVFEQVGFLNPQFHHGQGDFDYGLRARQKEIKSWVSSEFVGICERNKELPRWCNPKYPLHVRLKNFHSPLGGRPVSTFIFQKKYLGFATAIFHYLTIYLRLIFPKIWIEKKRNEN